MEIRLKGKYRAEKPKGRYKASQTGNSGKARHKGSVKPGIAAPKPPGEHARGVRTLVLTGTGRRSWQ